MKWWIKGILYLAYGLGMAILGSLGNFILRSAPWIVPVVVIPGGLIVAALLSWQAKKEAK
jgi:hypothetical protein